MLCRETLQREVMKSRHSTLKFLARRGFTYRGGLNWRLAHCAWLRQVTGTTSRSPRKTKWYFGGYFALLEYKRGTHDALEAHIAKLELTPPTNATIPGIAK